MPSPIAIVGRTNSNFDKRGERDEGDPIGEYIANLARNGRGETGLPTL
jgi:hypothetical protein